MGGVQILLQTPNFRQITLGRFFCNTKQIHEPTPQQLQQLSSRKPHDWQAKLQQSSLLLLYSQQGSVTLLGDQVTECRAYLINPISSVVFSYQLREHLLEASPGNMSPGKATSRPKVCQHLKSLCTQILTAEI